MTQFNNQNFISFSGEPITGRMPTKTVVYGPEMTGPQQAGVAHAYKLFCDAVNTSVGKYVVQNRVLADGTKVRMISNWGNDTVMVWPVGGDDELDIPPSGIGICFTAPDGSPVEGWSYLDDNDDAQPQPLILRPIPKLNDAGEVVGSGKWHHIKVTRLVGGKRLWVAKNRRKWLSTMASLVYQQPQANDFGIISLINYPLDIPNTVKAEWTATSGGRVDTRDDAKGRGVIADAGRYMFAGNDTVMQDMEPILSPPFISKLRLAGDNNPVNYVQLLDVGRNEIVVRRGLLKVYKGMADEVEKVFQPPASPYLDLDPVVVPITNPRLSLMPLTVSVHPDGKKAICMANLTSPSEYGKHIDIEMHEDGSVTYAYGDLGLTTRTTPAATGGGTWSETMTYTPQWVTNSALYYGTLDPADVGTDNAYYFRLESKDFNATTNKSVLTQNAQYSGSDTRGYTYLNRHYFDRKGDKVVEKVVYTATTTGNGTYSNTLTRDTTDMHTVDGVVTVPAVTTHSGVSVGTAINTASYQSTATLKNRQLDLLSSTADSSITVTATSGGSGVGPTPTSIIAEVSGSLTETTRDILHYDSVNDFIIYLEVTTTANASGSKNLIGAVGTEAYGDVSDLVTGSRTARIVAESRQGPVAYLSHTIAMDTPELSLRVPGFHPKAVVYDVSYVNEGTSTADTMSADITRILTSAGTAFGTRLYELWTEPKTWENTSESGTTTVADWASFPARIGATFERANHPKNYLQADYAVDPVTLSSVVHLRFNGAAMPGGFNEDKAWTVAVDATGVRPLSEVIKAGTPIPDDAVIYKDAFLNSLVSI